VNDQARTGFHLSELFSLSGLLADRDGDGLADGIRGLLVLSERAGPAEQVAAANLAARLGFETLACEPSLAILDEDGAESASTGQSPLSDRQRIPIFLGLPTTLSHACPELAAQLLVHCAPGQGIVAVTATPRPAVLVGGVDRDGLQAAVLAFVTDGLATGERIDDRSTDIEAVRISAAPTPEVETAAADQHSPLRSLGELFGPEGLAVDEDGDLLPDRSRTRLVLPSDLSAAEALAAIHLAARIGLESNGIAFPLAVEASAFTRADGEIPIVIQPLSDVSSSEIDGTIYLVSAEAGQEIRISGIGSGRAAALEALANLDVWTFGAEPTLAGLERAIDRAIALADPGTVLGAVIPALDELAGISKFSSMPPRIEINVPQSELLEKEVTTAVLQSRADEVFPVSFPSIAIQPLNQEVWLDETYRPDWEYEEAWRVLQTEIVPRIRALSAGDVDWRIDLRVSEPQGRRGALHAAIAAALRTAGRIVLREQIRILPTYHQGRAWMLEQILPRLLGMQAKEIVVRVRRVIVEDGALELPVRWLQDLFPVDELLAAGLNLPAAAVRFELQDDLAATYEIEAYDGTGSSILHDSLEACVGAQPYLSRFPAWGKVSPPTGCVRLFIGDQIAVDHHLASDPERLWRVLHDNVMPKVEAVIRERHGAPTRDLQPFFDELTVEAWLSEDDGVLGVREERNSPLEALHEDVYFGLLDYFTALIVSAEPNPYTPPWLTSANEATVRRDPRRLTAPGRVVPRIHRRDGMAPELRVRLLAPAPKASFQWQCGEAHGTIPLKPSHGVSAQVISLEFSGRRASNGGASPTAVLRLVGESDETARAAALLRGIGVLRTAGVEPGTGLPTDLGLRLADADPGVLLFPPRAATRNAATGEPNVPGSPEETLSLTRVPRRHEVNAYIERLGRLPEIQSYEIGHSAKGCALLAMEATVPRKGGWWSRAKLAGWKCSLLLNGRHHANEPASTTALLQMAELLASDPEWRRFLDRVNVLFLPGENADGMDLDDSLVAEHPNWMHHAARYNAAGLEFVAAGYDPNTVHTEALAQPALWRRWSPDIVCDCHGFPSHSWDQPFSGGCNQWFRDNSIPQALIYGIMPTADTESHRAAGQGIAKRLTEVIGADQEIVLWNEAHATQYKKYLTTQNPEQFPAPYADGLMIHHSFYDPKVGRPGLAGLPGRHPRLTTASLVTEVADETAQGAYLDLCARSHLLANRALLEYLYAAADPGNFIRRTTRAGDGRIHLTISRARPVLPT
jgi:hypothetical protein